MKPKSELLDQVIHWHRKIKSIDKQYQSDIDHGNRKLEVIKNLRKNILTDNNDRKSNVDLLLHHEATNFEFIYHLEEEFFKCKTFQIRR